MPSLARDYGEGGEAIPKPGDFVMVLDGEGRPRSISRTTEVTIKPLSQIGKVFAWDAGEGDCTREGGSMPIADISLGERTAKGSSARSLPCSTASRSHGRSMRG
jgi:hypothetical protein